MSKSTSKISSNISKNVSSTSKLADKKLTKESKTQGTRTGTKTTKTEIQKKSTSKNDEKEILSKSQAKLPSNSKISTVPVSNKNTVSHRSHKIETKPQPIRAKYTPEIVNSLKNTQNRSVNNKNVMNTIHNVTVLSPPIRRKQITTTTNAHQSQNKAGAEIKLTKTSPKQSNQTNVRTRTRTRTLDPDEIVILKKSPVPTNTGPKSLDTFVGGGQSMKANVNQLSFEKDSKINTKEPVAFEIILDEKNKSFKGRTEAKRLEKKSVENISKLSVQSGAKASEKEIDEYEDDFESYESDFETGSSSAETSEISVETPETENESTETETGTENDSEGEENLDKVKSFDETDCDESEETQPPITVIHKEKECERKLDSGNYDMHSRREKLQLYQQNQQQQLDSIDTITGNSEQLDSGISYNGGNTGPLSASSQSKSITAISSSIFATGTFNQATWSSSNMSKRGIELMKKIQLDTIDYVLFDLKPINYECYMKMYGNVNAVQATTQTKENQMSTEVQTDDYQYRSIWTQHPPQFDLNSIHDNNLRNSMNHSGEFDEETDDYSGVSHPNNENAIHPNDDTLMKSLKALRKFRRDELKRTEQIQKPINFDSLNEFLNRTVFTVSAILNKTTNQDHKKLHNSKDSIVSTDISKGYCVLNTNLLNALRVVKIFSNPNLNLILVVHESLDDGLYKSEFLNLISVWTTNDSEKPIRLLSTWSEVSRADICSENSDVVVCGLRDGSIAMWDLRETYSFCSKLDGYLRHFPATQSIAPILSSSSFSSSSHSKTTAENATDTQSMMSTDLGAVVDIKSFRKSNKINEFKTYKPIQLVSLNDTGILTIWTLVETGNAKNSHLFDDFKFKNPQKRKTNLKIEYNSPWARIKLIQSEICDLRCYLQLKNLRVKSAFEKTKSYFENDLFNDDVLKELQEITTNTITQQNEEFKFSVKGLRFTNLDTDLEEHIFIGTNRNFIIKCTKTLRLDQFRRIVFNETKFLFATTFRVLKTGEFLIIGLSNGSVMAINCSSNKLNNNQAQTDKDDMNDENSNKRFDDDEFELENGGKSCTIQNIIRNERRPHGINTKSDSLQSSFDECNNSHTQQEFNQNEFVYRIYDQQILLDGSILRKNLVQQIEFSDDGRKLFVLTDGHLRVYDFITDRELIMMTDHDNRSSSTIIGLTMTRQNASNQHLVTLTRSNQVQVHILK